ncbi:unnamed protein product [Anisakis simplex]|uniref:t-SNARE coiled-coil homology domain-containing protein n=1 Tax=Anisakis simplex TaxID=6269 RepID=A0A0M3JSA0_ANISI|nr:unnamed protein product [Anisakis simplex]
MDEVEVEADGAFDYPRQSFVIRKYCSGGRTIRYFDHQMSHPINDRPLTFFPPTIKKFLTYQKRLKAVPLKKQDEGLERSAFQKMGYTDAIIYNKDDKTITTNMQDLKNSLMASKSFIQQLKGRVDKITPEIRQCAADMDSGINQMTQLFSRINTAKQ